MITFTHSQKKENLFSDYCQFLIASVTNWTQTYFAARTEKWSHDQLNRFLRNENISSSELWQSVKDDIEYDDADATIQECPVRWKIEQFHREIKQATGIGKCQCRKLRAQRNHIACCFQVWVCLTRTARAVGRTIYELKDSLLDDYLRYQLSNPSIIFKTA